MSKNEKTMMSVYNYFKKIHPDNVAMPLIPETKKPVYPHKNGWTWDDVENLKFINYGLLCKTICVWDIDDKKTEEKLINLFPDDFNNAPMETTKKGSHYFFLRNYQCDIHNLYDKSRIFGIDNDPVDFKSICSTGTCGVLSIAPSKNKNLVRNFYEYEMKFMSEELINYLVKNWDKNHLTHKKIENNIKKFIVEDLPTTDIKNNFPIVKNIELIEAKRQVNLLSFKRSDTFSTWINTLWCLKNISPEMKSDWHNFSKKSNKYKFNESENLWNNTIPKYNDKKSIKLGSLLHWAKEDNEEKFYMIKESLYSYNAVKYDFEKNNIKIRTPFHFIESYNNDITIRDRKELLHVNENLYYCEIDKDKSNNFICTYKPFVQEWLKDQNMATKDYKDVLPPPLKTPDNYYNLWQGFPVEKIKPNNDVDDGPNLMIEHIEMLMNKDNDINGKKTAKFMLDFIAHAFQKTGELPKVAIVLYGQMGAGKDMIFDFLNKLSGQYYYQTDDPENSLFGAFPEGLKHKVFVNVSELNPKDGYKLNDRIKNIVTEPTIKTKIKYRCEETSANLTRLCFTTNKEFCIYIDEKERRLVVVECNPEKIGNRAYFKKLGDWCDQPKNQRRFYDDMMARNIEGLYLPDERPETNLMKDLKNVNLPYFIKYCKFIIENCQPKNMMFSGINNFAEDVRDKIKIIEGGDFKMNISDGKLSREINKYNFIIKNKGHGPNTYIIDYDKMKYYLIDNNYIDYPDNNKGQYLFRDLIS